MIRGISQKSQQKSIHFPKYGQFGYNQPVGRKHYQGRVSAIHKLIFNDQSTITRQVYREPSPNISKKHQWQSQRHETNSLMTRQPSIKSNYSIISYDYSPNKYKDIQSYGSHELSPQSPRHHGSIYQNRDSLDMIINPYKQYSPSRKRQSNDEGYLHRANNPTFLNSLL